MNAPLRLPSLAALRASPSLSLPPPAGNPAHNPAMPAADWILEFPPGGHDPAGTPGAPAEVTLPRDTPASAASPSGTPSEQAAADAFSDHQLPCAGRDRPPCDPEEKAAGVGEALPSCTNGVGRTAAPPPDPVSNGVWNNPAAGQLFFEAIHAERAQHFARGHDLASDVAAIADNPRKLSRRAERFIVLAVEDLQFRRPGWRTRAQHHVAQAAAMLLAFHDAIDAFPEIPDAL